jgi:DsbC/DsbD-like thiol-disulfide interchange protein
MMGRIVNVVVLVLVAMVSGLCADDPITWSLKADSSARQVRAGDTFEVQAVARMAAGWHLYSLTQQGDGPLPTRITLPEGQPFELSGAIKSPPPLTELDAVFEIETEFYEESATFVLPVRVAPDAPAGEQTLRVDVFFQSCDDRVCLPPKTVELKATVVVAQDPKAIEKKEKPVAAPTAAPRERQIER